MEMDFDLGLAGETPPKSVSGPGKTGIVTSTVAPCTHTLVCAAHGMEKSSERQVASGKKKIFP